MRKQYFHTEDKGKWVRLSGKQIELSLDGGKTYQPVRAEGLPQPDTSVIWLVGNKTYRFYGLDEEKREFTPKGERLIRAA